MSLEPAEQSRALADVTVTASTRERKLDGETARLFSDLWRTLVARTQVVQEVGVFTVKLDGVGYDFWHGDGEGQVSSPRDASILGRTVFVGEWLSDLVERPKPEDAKDLPFIRDELRTLLARTKANEPCLKPYEG